MPIVRKKGESRGYKLERRPEYPKGKTSKMKKSWIASLRTKILT